MSTADRILNFIGSAASGLLIAVEGGSLPVPWWLKLAAAIVAPVALGSASPMLKRNSLTAPKPDARGQVSDAENPR
jgi:hypothetical protein